MMPSALAAFLLAGLIPDPPQAEEEFKLGPKVVQMRDSSYYANPNPPRKPFPDKKPQYGDPVTAVAREGKFARATFPEGGGAYVYWKVLIDPELFDGQPESEEEKVRLKAQNYKSGRFDKEIENQYIDDKGPDMRRAFGQLDALMARPKVKADRLGMEKELAAYRQAGKLGEFSSVK